MTPDLMALAAELRGESSCVSADVERFLVPFEPTEAQWNGLARTIMLWLCFGPPHTPRSLLKHLKRMGAEVPSWLLEESEMKALDHSMSKGTRCTIVYKAMLSDHRRAGLVELTKLGEEMDAIETQGTPQPSPEECPNGCGWCGYDCPEAKRVKIQDQCSVCDGDCASANPPPTFCPMRDILEGTPHE